MGGLDGWIGFVDGVRSVTDWLRNPEENMATRLALVFVTVAALATGGSPRAQTSTATLANQVRDAERAFAKTMADRNHAAFVSFLADETVFMGQETQRGKQAVAAA